MKKEATHFLLFGVPRTLSFYVSSMQMGWYMVVQSANAMGCLSRKLTNRPGIHWDTGVAPPEADEKESQLKQKLEVAQAG